MLRIITGHRFNVALIVCAVWTAPAGIGRAATLEWVKQFGTSAHDWATAIDADQLGNVFVGGTTGGNLGGPRVGFRDAFISKFDATGQIQWSKQFGTQYRDNRCYDVSADGLGNVYVAGASLYLDGFLNKFDAAGNMEWSRQIVTSGADFVRGVSADGLGSVYITGSTNNESSFLARYDAVGNLLWTQQLGTSGHSVGYAVSADRLGNVFVTGRSVDKVFVKKFDATGGLDWTQTFGMRVQNIGTGASTDGLGNVYISGVSSNGVTFAPFVSKVNVFGTIEWTRELYSIFFGEFSSPLFQKIYLYNDPSIAVSTDGKGGIYASESGGRSQFYRLSKLDAAGNLLWEQSLTSPDLLLTPVVSNDGMGNAYIAGLTFGNLGGTNFGGQDALVAKFSDPPVPEPAAWQLLALFCIVLLYHRRPV